MRHDSLIHIRRPLLASAAAVALLLGTQIANAADIVRPQPVPARIVAPAPGMWAYVEGGWYHYSGSQFFGGNPAPGWFINGAVGTNNPNGWNFTLGGGYANSKS